MIQTAPPSSPAPPPSSAGTDNKSVHRCPYFLQKKEEKNEQLLPAEIEKCDLKTK